MIKMTDMKVKIKEDSILPYRKCSLHRPKYAQRNKNGETRENPERKDKRTET
jgi:hypothetical protein